MNHSRAENDAHIDKLAGAAQKLMDRGGRRFEYAFADLFAAVQDVLERGVLSAHLGGRSSVHFDDMLSAAGCVVTECLTRWDPQKGAFSSYLSTAARNAATAEFGNMINQSEPGARTRQRGRLNAARDRLLMAGQMNPDMEDLIGEAERDAKEQLLARHPNMDETAIRTRLTKDGWGALRRDRRFVSMDGAPLRLDEQISGEEQGPTYAERIEYGSGAQQEHQVAAFASFLMDQVDDDIVDALVRAGTVDALLSEQSTTAASDLRSAGTAAGRRAVRASARKLARMSCAPQTLFCALDVELDDRLDTTPAHVPDVVALLSSRAG